MVADLEEEEEEEVSKPSAKRGPEGRVHEGRCGPVSAALTAFEPSTLIEVLIPKSGTGLGAQRNPWTPYTSVNHVLLWHSEVR